MSWESDWGRMLEAVGIDFAAGDSVIARDAVDASSIRRFCEPLEFGCPLHHDADLARHAGFRDLVAPWSGTYWTWPDAGQWSPGDPTRYPAADTDADSLQLVMPGRAEPPMPEVDAAFATDIEIEFFEPVCVGDRLTTFGRVLREVVPRETRVGRGAFLKWEKSVRNQHGELVATVRNGMYHYRRAEQPEPATGTAPSEAAAPPAPATSTHAEGVPILRPIDWTARRYAEDLKVGMELPPLAFNLTTFRLVMAAGAVRDFAQGHHNTPVARRQGAQDMYADVVFLLGTWERTVREFVGLEARFRRIGPFRIRQFSPVGETIVVRGEVTGAWDADGEHFVEFEVRAEHSKGVSVGPGPVVVAVPGRRDADSDA